MRDHAIDHQLVGHNTASDGHHGHAKSPKLWESYHTQKELIPSQKTTPPKLTGSKGAQVQACEGAGNTAEVLQSTSDHLLDTAATQQLYRGLNLAFSWGPPFNNISLKQIMTHFDPSGVGVFKITKKMLKALQKLCGEQEVNGRNRQFFLRGDLSASGKGPISKVERR